MRLHRLLGILSILLSRETISAKELSHRFDVSLRTIYRDIKAIEAAGIPLYTTPGNGGGIGIVSEYKLNKTALSNTEMNYLAAGISGLKTITDTENLQILLSKLYPSNSYFVADSDILIDFSVWNPNTTEALKQKIAVIRMAIMNQHYLKMEYISAHQKSELKIAPSKIVFKGSAWYLFGKSTYHKEFRFYKITRITKIELLNEPFTLQSVDIPTDWSDDFQDETGEKITLLFDKSMEYQIIDLFGANQYEYTSDNSILVVFYCSNKDWLIHFLLGFGTKVKMISPAIWKEEYLNYLKKIIEENNC